ncbi:MAG TPA: rhodanese-like domain-containing protein [Vicinamibacterales bacterium]|nr:rhodanese-like domain-containing protein [Vicinamibacterales bacterium]
MPVSTLSVERAHAAQLGGATYIDVRSGAEFAAGRPAGAINVPLLDNDEDTGQLLPNPDFVRVMRANFPADAPLLVGCQSGGRSSRAAQMLEAFGFTCVTNVPGGYESWKPSGLPTEAATPPSRAYAELLAVANASETDGGPGL